MTEIAYALLRIVAGLMFAFNGVQKLFGLWLGEQKQPEIGSLFWFGGIIELVCGIAIAFGLLTRWAAFLASGTMAVAYIKFHWMFAVDKNFFPTINEGELALLYAFVFLFIACRGGGWWSADAHLRRSRQSV